MRHTPTYILLASALAFAGCDRARPVPGAPSARYTVPTGDPTHGQAGPTAIIAVGDCTRCHGTPGLDNAGSDPLVAAAPPRTPLGETSGAVVGAHRAHLVDGPFSHAIECASCHLLPTSSDHRAQDQGRITFSRLATDVWDAGAPLSPAWDPAARTCASTYCHGTFTNGASATPSWTGAGTVVCGSCHGVSPTNGPGGTHPTLGGTQTCGSCHGGGYTNTSVDLSLHLNGRLDGGLESEGGIPCGGCHATIFAGMSGTTHPSRHALGAVAGTNDAWADSGPSWLGTLSAVVPADRSCVNMCHGDHPHDLTSPATATHENNVYLDATTSAARADGAADRIGVGGTGGTPNRAKTDWDAAQANGGLCASCHRSPVDASRAAVDPAAFDASAHDYASNTVGASTYAWTFALHDGGLFVRDCTKCHASRAEGTTPAAAAAGSTTRAVHFSDDPSLLAGATNPAGTAAGFVCYNCHGSGAAPAAGAQGDRSGKDIQSQIAHATATGQSGHPASSDAVHDSSAEFSTAAWGNALGVAAGTGQRHASCLDCHEPHRAKAGAQAAGTNLAGPPLQGAWGAKLATNPAFWTAPGSGSFSKRTLTTGTPGSGEDVVEATLCFKCHSSFYWGAGTPPDSPGLGAPQTDTAMEFNPNNTGNFAGTWASGETAGGFHPVLASAGANLGATSNVLSPWTRTSLMACSDCHASDAATDPNGPHGSAARFILKGPNTAWDATLLTVRTVVGTQTHYYMPSGAFCANCHDRTWTSSRFPAHDRNDHQVACWNCHAAVPHGGPRPGMLVGTGGACTGLRTPNNNCQADVGGLIAGWDRSSPYAGLAPSGTTLYIMGYPADNTTAWDQNNCGCGTGGGH